MRGYSDWFRIINIVLASKGTLVNTVYVTFPYCMTLVVCVQSSFTMLIWTTWNQYTVYWLINMYIYIYIHWHIGMLASTTSEEWRCVLESSLWLPGYLKFITSLHRKGPNLQYKYGKRTTVNKMHWLTSSTQYSRSKLLNSIVYFFKFKSDFFILACELNCTELHLAADSLQMSPQAQRSSLLNVFVVFISALSIILTFSCCIWSLWYV